MFIAVFTTAFHWSLILSRTNSVHSYFFVVHFSPTYLTLKIAKMRLMTSLHPPVYSYVRVSLQSIFSEICKITFLCLWVSLTFPFVFYAVRLVSKDTRLSVHQQFLVILSCNLYLVLPACHFPSGFPTKPTERPPLVDEVGADLCGLREPRGQRDGSLRPYSRFSRPEQLLRSRTQATEFIFFPTKLCTE
jgi:hypothetical protein